VYESPPPGHRARRRAAPPWPAVLLVSASTIHASAAIASVASADGRTIETGQWRWCGPPAYTHRFTRCCCWRAAAVVAPHVGDVHPKRPSRRFKTMAAAPRLTPTWCNSARLCANQWVPGLTSPTASFQAIAREVIRTAMRRVTGRTSETLDTCPFVLHSATPFFTVADHLIHIHIDIVP
jgi:hypothetical protein